MKVLRKKVKIYATSGGRVLALTLPMKIAKELGVKKGDRAEWIYKYKKLKVVFEK